jgi:hypothetical protein
MKHLEIFEKWLKWSYNTLHNYEFKVDMRTKPNDFSRDRKLNFPKTCLLILNNSKNSLQSAIYTFLNESKSKIESISKQAFSERRQNIKPEAFLTLFRGITDSFYNDPDVKPKSFYGMHVFAIDGTTYNLPNTPDLTEIYGVQTSQGLPQTQAKGSCLYDVLNDLLIDVKMLPIKSSEREIAVEHLKYLIKIKPENNLVLFDRGYPSFELMHFLNKNKISYVMRCSKDNFLTEIRDMNEDDKVFQLERKLQKTKENASLLMRVVKFPLDNGNEETLITNITDSSYTKEDFKYLYHLRWGIEEKYDEIKNKLKIEAFSGTTPVAVLQDFYATMFLTNLVSHAERDSEDELKLKNDSLDKKYKYKINRTMAISSVKISFIELVMADNPRKQKRLLKRLAKRLINNIIPIRSGRSFPRIKKHESDRFPQNRKNI